MLAAVVPTVSESGDHGKNSGEVGVIAAVFTGEERMQRVMEVVAPLGVEAVSAVRRVGDDAGVVQVALGDQVEWTIQSLGQVIDRGFQLRQEMAGAEIEDAVDGVQTEGVKVKVLQPIVCVFDKESPDLVAAWAVKIDGLTPRGAVTVRKVRRVCAKVVAFRA